MVQDLEKKSKFHILCLVVSELVPQLRVAFC